MKTEELNAFILKATIRNHALLDTQRLEKNQFFYRNWKLTLTNNSQTGAAGVDWKTGKNKYELLRRICCLGNQGGGVLCWGISRDNMIEGLKLSEEEKEKILLETEEWKNEFVGSLTLKREFVPVLADPFGPKKAESLDVLRIEVYPESQAEMFFALKLNKKGMHTRYQTYSFDVNGQPAIVEGRAIYEMITKSYSKQLNRRAKRLSEDHP